MAYAALPDIEIRYRESSLAWLLGMGELLSPFFRVRFGIVLPVPCTSLNWNFISLDLILVHYSFGFGFGFDILTPQTSAESWSCAHGRVKSEERGAKTTARKPRPLHDVSRFEICGKCQV